MKGAEIRRTFLEFFRSKGHTEVASSSLVPHDDPTLLFINAGMNQFKDCFLGSDKRSYTRATTSQKCMRIAGKHNDFENVGVTARHHTFFEMLGNFSFGDYFKEDAIRYAWELVTERFKLPKERLWVTIFENDDEAEKLWINVAKVAPERIIRLGEKDNFWAMGDTGPCGPCTEIHVYRGDDVAKQSREGFLQGNGDYLEIWNLVFMQFNRDQSGKLTPLPKPSVDTGMGLERITSVINNLPSNYDTDLLRAIISKTEELSGFTYDGRSFEVRDLRSDLAYARDVAMRVIADHSRAAAFAIADGVMPGNEGRGYVLRRILRRAIRHGRVLQFKAPFLADTTGTVISLFGEHYPELREQAEQVRRVVHSEETKFHETLDAGLALLQKEVEKLPHGSPLPGATAFLLHDTYGFPLDLTEDALKAYKIGVDVAGFERAMEAQRSRSRADREGRGITFVSRSIDAAPTTFLGYQETKAEASITAVLDNDGEGCSVVVDATPFYAESGGQVGDTGTLTLGGVTVRVVDTQKTANGVFVHRVHASPLEQECLKKGARVQLAIDEERRTHIRRHHSATHIVHAALRKILGTHVKQAGSRVDENSSRFDFSHFEGVSPAMLSEMQSYVNELVQRDVAVETKELPIEEAKRTGAMALFGEKYGDKVRVVFIGPESIEFCGGTHVKRGGEIGSIAIVSEGAIAAGVRRIESVAGRSAIAELHRLQELERSLAERLKSDRAGIGERVEGLLAKLGEVERELSGTKQRLAGGEAVTLAKSATLSSRGFKVIAAKVDASDVDTLRAMIDAARREIGSGVVALGARQGESGVLVVGVTPDLVGRIKAGDIVKEVAQTVGARGGGRPDFAQMGGVALEKLPLAIEKIQELTR